MRITLGHHFSGPIHIDIWPRKHKACHDWLLYQKNQWWVAGLDKPGSNPQCTAYGVGSTHLPPVSNSWPSDPLIILTLHGMTSLPLRGKDVSSQEEHERSQCKARIQDSKSDQISKYFISQRSKQSSSALPRAMKLSKHMWVPVKTALQFFSSNTRWHCTGMHFKTQNNSFVA